MKEIKRIVLTGGPCAGKTTALVRIIEHFSSLGFKVFTVPEVPTLFSQGGWNYLTPNYDLYYQGELAILEMQLALKDSFMRLAETCTKPAFVVCDRGTLDIAAYMKPGMWKELTERVNFTPTELRHRYDAVLHLVSAADELSSTILRPLILRVMNR
jgi:predicted ATPase